MEDQINQTTLTGEIQPSSQVVLDSDVLKSVNNALNARAAFSQFGNTNFVIVPEGYQLQNVSKVIEQNLPAPHRRKGVVNFQDCQSFIDYINSHKVFDIGTIYADSNNLSFTCILNDHGPTHVKYKESDDAESIMAPTECETTPGWQDFVAKFSPEKTKEFLKWVLNNNKDLTQTEFAEFIEDNLADLQEGGSLLDMATTIQANTGIHFSSARRLQDGQTQLTYNESIDAKAGSDGNLKIPKTFVIGLRIFKNGSGYKLTARLKYRLYSGTIKFRYEIERVEVAVEDAFNDYITQLEAQANYPVYKAAIEAQGNQPVYKTAI